MILSRRHHGFTLIELLVAVAILAIVAAVAMPIYSTYSDRSYRSEAQADLLLCAQGMERWAGTNFDYLGAADTNGDGVGDANAGNPAAQVCDPRSVDAGRYTLTVAATATTFTLRATPIAQMAGDGFMTIDQAGARAWDKNNNGSIGAGEDDWSE
ncbi:MAG: prepilin-type N-terminal cleavage/methylation domain-containing protein [Pseudomonadales bacterium]|nr:prepilin-type N-terminal cleavage/methylation domain-containing protein [Pseudomonadales bacterium]MCP5184461.1 prepilin-type N-terminal cleavage/methylation domain-containing protein [Pseudomonadales bacterium]